MADLALRLKVFVASPGDLLAERDIVEKLVAEHSPECARHRLLLQSFRWENGLTPGFERPNARTVRQLRTAELTVVIFWSRLGSAASLGASETGSIEEMRVAGERVSRGMSDDVFIYFKTAQPPESARSEDVQQVAALRSSLEASKSVVLSDFATMLEFEHLFRRHIRLWVERWNGIPEICEYALDQSGGGGGDVEHLADNLVQQALTYLDLEQLRALAPIVGRHAVETYQRLGPAGAVQPLPTDVVRAIRDLDPVLQSGLVTSESAALPPNGAIAAPPLLQEGRSYRLSQPAWFFLFCAAGLLQAIRASSVEAVMRVPYINEVHQSLKALATEFRVKREITSVLRRWLVSEDGCTDNRPVARNFAAYALGMLGTLEAQEDLARVIHEDSGRDVRLYAIAALGKLRARQHMPELRDVFARETDPRVRLMAAQAICRMTGVADYEL